MQAQIMTNVAPIPGNLPTAPAGIGGLTPGSPLIGASGGPRTSPLVRYLAAVRRVKWLVLLLTLAGLGAGYLITRLRPATYVVRARLQIAPNTNNASTFANDQWKQYFGSYVIIEPVVLARRLFIKGPKRVGAPPLPLGPSGPAAALFNGLTVSPQRFATGTYRLKISDDGRTWEMTNITMNAKERGAVGDSVGRTFGLQWVPQVENRWRGQTFEFDMITPREAADVIKGQLTINLARLSPRFMDLALEGQDAASTAGTLNDLMQQFVTQAAATKSRDLTRSSHVLDSQLTQENIKLQEYMRALQTYRTHIITLPHEELPVAPGLEQTSPSGYTAYLMKTQQLEALKRDRRELYVALAKDTSGEPVVDQFNMIPAAKASPELLAVIQELMTSEQTLRQNRLRYGDGLRTAEVDMPRLIQHVRDLRMITIPTAVQAVIRNLDAAIARTDSEVKAGGHELESIPTRSIEESDLRRKEALQEKIVSDLMEKWQDATTRVASALPDVEVLDPAVAPLNPNRNRSAVLIAMGALAGLGAGLALALLLDVTDKRVRYVDQISAGLGLTILGVIPEIRRVKGEQPSADEAAQVIEAFRTVRLNLAHTVSQNPVMLTVSSPAPGDGKSLVASNLALSFAESGYRSLLIDGDTRRGELHRTFGAERRPGLLDYLAGEIPMESLLRPTTHPQLQLITGGSRKRNAPELLGTARMRELIENMRERFDVVIVDSPPMGAGIDPFVLGTITGNLMLVLRAGSTERDLAEAKLQIVDQLPIRLVGAVLNDVRASMNDYKYYSYSYGYGAVDEDAAPIAIAAPQPSGKA
jgi:succinoglycan biosynthesis transport protein ExoP